MSGSLRNAVKRHSVLSQPGLRGRWLILEKRKEIPHREKLYQVLEKRAYGVHNTTDKKSIRVHKLIAGTSESLLPKSVPNREQNERKIWKTLGGRTVGSTKVVLKAEECRTSLSREGHNLLKNASTEARPSNQIRQPVPVGKGLLPLSVRHICTQSALAVKQQSGRAETSETGITTQEDPFDTLTDKIPVQPVSVAEGASYSIAIFAGLAVAAAAAYTIFKELIIQPKEYKVYGKALDRVQTDMQIAGRLGSPIHGYGQESQNRAARQRISNRQWDDEDGVEHVEVMFYVRGPGGGGKVFCEMFKDPEDKFWKFTYLIVDVTHPTPKRFLLESYVPQVKVNLSPA